MGNNDKQEKKCFKGWAPFWKTLIQAAVLLTVVCVVICWIINHGYHVIKENTYLITDTVASVPAMVVSNSNQVILSESSSGNVSTAHEEMVNLLIALIAISATIMVGFQIFNTLEYRNVLKEFEEKQRKLEEAKKEMEKTTKKTKTNVDRIDGDHSRMMAFLLCEQQKPTWAMGWLGRAIKSYDRAYLSDPKEMDKSYPDLMKQAVKIEIANIKTFTKLVSANTAYKTAKTDEDYKKAIFEVCCKDNDENDRGVLKRTYKDVLDSRIVVKLNGDEFDMQESDEQTDIIENYMKLLTSLVSDKDIEYANRSSRYKDSFMPRVEKYQESINGKTTKELFDELVLSLQKL